MTDFEEQLQALEARYQQGVADFKQVSFEFDNTLTSAQQEYPPMSVEKQEELAEHYRSGAAGSVLRDIQQRVDQGELTWNDVTNGTADAGLTEAYYSSFEEGGKLLRAAVNGEPISEYLPYYSNVDVEADLTNTDGTTPRRDVVEDDDYFDNARFLDE